MKLLNDFGVSAWLASLIIIGAFVIIGIGVRMGLVSYEILLPMIGSWVGSVVTAYFVFKGMKSGKE